MTPEQRIQQLERKYSELEQKMLKRERQQISFPLDTDSKASLSRDFIKTFDIPHPSAKQKGASIDNTTLVASLTSDATNGTVYKGIITIGEETENNQGPYDSSKNTQIYIENAHDSADLQSFMYGYRKPIYKTSLGSTSSVTSGGSTLTDSTKKWTVNELAGAFINVMNSSGAFQFTRQIASNTATQITIDGTWPSDVAGGSYFVFMPVFLGSADYPWRQIYAGGTDVSSGGTGAVRRAIRIGYGTTSGADSIGIYFGTSSPEGVVTANIGSLFLRTDGSTSTTLYVKTSGSGNTGWTAK